jgi:hypothetical protein
MRTHQAVSEQQVYSMYNINLFFKFLPKNKTCNLQSLDSNGAEHLQLQYAQTQSWTGAGRCVH